MRAWKNKSSELPGVSESLTCFQKESFCFIGPPRQLERLLLHLNLCQSLTFRGRNQSSHLNLAKLFNLRWGQWQEARMERKQSGHQETDFLETLWAPIWETLSREKSKQEVWLWQYRKLSWDYLPASLCWEFLLISVHPLGSSTVVLSLNAFIINCES